MISPKEIHVKAERRYRDFLVSIVKNEHFFPFDIPFAKVKPGESVSRWVELRREFEALRRMSSESRPGVSYTVVWEEHHDRLAGVQLLPSRITFVDEESFLAFLGKRQECGHFREDFCSLMDAFPTLADWVAARPEVVIRHKGEWKDIAAVLRWFVENPRSGLYLREVPAVSDTKFIESRKPLFESLLFALRQLPVNVSEARGGENRRSFEEKHGLKVVTPLMRLRILDALIAERRFSGIDDMAIPVDRFSLLNFDEIERILVIENKTSFGRAEVFLTAPAMRGTIAIFGSGYATSALSSISWIETRRIGYWGDIDSHGLRILGAFRSLFPRTEALLMDEAVFDTFPEYHSDSPADDAEEPKGLTSDEMSLFRRLVSLSSKNRLEQERIPIQYARSKLKEWWLKTK